MLERRRAYAWTGLTLILGAGLQLAVYRHGGHTALGDIPGRFFAWRLGPRALPYLDRPVEYPVVIGMIAYLTALVARTATSFFALTALMSVALSLLMTRLLWTRSPQRVTRWALALPLLLYGFHNWDLFAMVPAVLGIMAFECEDDLTAGAWLGLGFSIKVFPGLIIPPLVVRRWWRGDRRGAVRLVGAAVAVTAVLNAPVMIASWKGWSYPARFQGARHATWGSLVSWVTSPPWGGVSFADPSRIANLVAGVALVIGLIVVCVVAVRRPLTPAMMGAAAVGVFLLTNKVYSPNYDLWLVPFFVLVPFSRRQWVAFCLADLAVFVAVFGRFHGWIDPTLGGDLVPYFIFVRAAVIVTLIWTALGGSGPRDQRAPRRSWPGRAPVSSPCSSVTSPAKMVAT